MKASFNWLCELVPGIAEQGPARVAQVLTDRGLEIEGTEDVGAGLSGLLIAEVTGIRPHPNAEKLRIVSVRAGGRVDDVVCGAPNVPPPGNRVCWAAPGARLPDGRTLEAKEVRGVVSPGMLCSEPELGLGEKGDGIIILSPSDPSGADFVSHFGVRDRVFEVNVTPNRGDALSHLGLARELSAAFKTPLVLGDVTAAASDGGRTVDVQIDDDVACPRYQARFISGLTVAPSPLTMRLRLSRCGIRALSNLVDVTNYVLLETGHPLHAFDLDRLEGPITARRARPDERITTLDSVERTLVPGDVVIADAKGPVAIAGVMGGARTEVNASTRNVLLEAATFDPISVRRTSKRLGLFSEASYRYERGVDPSGIPHAAARAAALLARLGGGGMCGDVVDRYPRPASPRAVTLSLSRLQRVAGIQIPVESAHAALREVSESVQVTNVGADQTLTVQVPTYRTDLRIAEDLIEEVLRIGHHYGTPAQADLVASNSVSQPHPEAPLARARTLFVAAGYNEIVSWAFVPHAALQAMADGRAPELSDGVNVKNPISADYEVMRTSLLPGLLDALKRNISRGNRDVGLFEVGPVVLKVPGGALQTNRAAAILSGRAAAWLKPGEPVDFFDAKAALEGLLAGFGVDIDAGTARLHAPADVPYLHPGVSAVVRVGERRVGVIGELNPLVARKLGLQDKAFFFEVEVDAVASHAQTVRGIAPPRFPGSTRDISFWIDVGTPADAQRDAFVSAQEPLLRRIDVLEDFRDPKYAPAGKKGMLWSMTYRSDDKTLTDAEADAAHSRVVNALKSRHLVTVR